MFACHHRRVLTSCRMSDASDSPIDSRQPGSNMSRRQNDDQQLEQIVTDEPIRASTPGGQNSQPPSPSGSPPLSTKVSLPQLVPARSRAPENRSPDDQSTQFALPQRPPPAHRSKSVSGSGVGRSTTWTGADTDTINKLPTPRIKGATRSGSSAQEEGNRSRSKGIVAFLKSGKSRGKSPASTKKYPEGVLGKEGCRVWVKE